MRAVIFDLDGTLVDSLGDIAHFMNEALADIGLPTHAVESYRGFVGGGVKVLGERATAGRDVDLKALVKSFASRYRAQPVRHTAPFEGIEPMLAQLQENGVVLAVLSNKPHDLTEVIVETLLADVPFVQVWGHKSDFPRKPDPTSALEIARRIEVAPSDCVFVGDTDVDILTACNSQMVPIGVTWGFRPVGELRGAGAKLTADDPAELGRMIEGLAC